RRGSCLRGWGRSSEPAWIRSRSCARRARHPVPRQSPRCSSEPAHDRGRVGSRPRHRARALGIALAVAACDGARGSPASGPVHLARGARAAGRNGTRLGRHGRRRGRGARVRRDRGGARPGTRGRPCRRRGPRGGHPAVRPDRGAGAGTASRDAGRLARRGRPPRGRAALGAGAAGCTRRARRERSRAAAGRVRLVRIRPRSDRAARAGTRGAETAPGRPRRRPGDRDLAGGTRGRRHRAAVCAAGTRVALAIGCRPAFRGRSAAELGRERGPARGGRAVARAAAGRGAPRGRARLQLAGGGDAARRRLRGDGRRLPHHDRRRAPAGRTAVVRVSPTLAMAAALGVLLGLGLWTLVALLPRIGAGRLTERIAPYVLDVSSEARELRARRGGEPGSLIAELLAPFLQRVGSGVTTLLGGDATVERRLRQSGSTITVAAFRARQLLWAAGGAALGILAALVPARSAAVSPPVMVVLAVAAAASGLLLPEQLLARRARARLRRIADELPTVLEFLSLALAAGETVRDALRRVARIGSG